MLFCIVWWIEVQFLKYQNNPDTITAITDNKEML